MHRWASRKARTEGFDGATMAVQIATTTARGRCRVAAPRVPTVTSLGSIASPHTVQEALGGWPEGHAPRLPLLRELTERCSGVTVLLVAVDVLALAVAALVAGPGLQWTVVTAAVLLGCRAATRLYRRRLWLSWFHELPRSLATTAMALGLLVTVALVTGEPAGAGSGVPSMVLLFVAINEVPRAGVFHLCRWVRRRYGRAERAVVVGATPVGADLVRTMLDHPEFGLRPVGFVDPAPPADTAGLPAPLFDDDLADVIERHRVDTVVLAFTSADDSQVVDITITAHRLGCTLLIVPRMYELYHDVANIERLRSYPLVRLAAAPTSRPSWWIKRTLDSLIAAVTLAVVSPVLALCALAVLLESGRPVIFTQERVGLDGHTFLLHKLRSLHPVDELESQTRWSVVGDPRIGPVGRFLRRTSLDEVPQLWNIVLGDMSLVGPRPERPGFVQEFSAIHERYWARHRVPAGLTGLAQINGLRGDTSIADRARYDNYYIANWSLWLDLKIILMTGRELLRHGEC